MFGGGKRRRRDSDSDSSTEHSAPDYDDAQTTETDDWHHQQPCDDATETEIMLRRRLDDARADNEQLRDDLEHADAHWAADKRRLDAAETRTDNQRRQIGELMRRLDSVKKERAAAEEALVHSDGRASTLHTQRERARDENAMLRRQLEEIKLSSARSTPSEELVEDYEKTINEQRADIDKLEESMKHMVSLKTHNAALKEAVDKERQLARAEKGAQLQAQLDAAAKHFDEYKVKVTALAATREEVKRLRNECGAKQRQCDNALSVVSEQRAEMAQLEKEVLQLKSGCKDKADRRAQLHQHMAPLQSSHCCACGCGCGRQYSSVIAALVQHMRTSSGSN